MGDHRSKNLVWIDCEMTGLDPDRDFIIEIATIITDSELNVLAEGPNLIIHRDASHFDLMDQWNRDQHTKSGLWKQVVESQLTAAEAEAQTIDFIKLHCDEKGSPLCGNSVWQDRRFLYRHMPKLEQYLHYRLIDVSTLKELYKRWFPQSPSFSQKPDSHRALDDIRASIDELKYYRQKMMLAPTSTPPARTPT